MIIYSYHICINIINFIILKSLLGIFQKYKIISQNHNPNTFIQLYILDHLFFSKNIKYHYHYYI
jgi:hypothetical protein